MSTAAVVISAVLIALGVNTLIGLQVTGMGIREWRPSRCEEIVRRLEAMCRAGLIDASDACDEYAEEVGQLHLWGPWNRRYIHRLFAAGMIYSREWFANLRAGRPVYGFLNTECAHLLPNSGR